MTGKRLPQIITLSILTLLIFSGCSQKGITFSEVWARPGVQGGNSAVYFTIENSDSVGEQLTGASSSIAGTVELHRSVMDASGTMAMEPQEQVDLPAGAEVSFEPGGLHVMLVGLTQELDPGDRFQLTLSFQSRETMTIEVPVKEP